MLGGTRAGGRASVGGVEMGAAERLGDSRGLGISAETRETPREESLAPLGYTRVSGRSRSGSSHEAGRVKRSEGGDDGGRGSQPLRGEVDRTDGLGREGTR